MFIMAKILISAVIIALATELSNYHRILAAILISMPIISILSFIWIYLDTQDTQKISLMSIDIVWYVTASLPFFFILPQLIKMGLSFWLSLSISCLSLFILYPILMWIRH